MAFLKSIQKRIQWIANGRFNKQIGFYSYQRYGKNIYIRHPKHYLKVEVLEWCCQNLYFHFYHPKNDEVVIDLGAGYGEEAVYLSLQSPKVRYYGVEPQPVIYECLSNTFHELGSNFQAIPYAISNHDNIRFQSALSYRKVNTNKEDYIEIPSLNWNEFLDKYEIHEIDLLKMNIEGAEKDVLKQINDFSIIKRLIISCHDFRSARGENESFKSKEVVTSTLINNGFDLRTFSYGRDWADDWIYAERK